MARRYSSLTPQLIQFIGKQPVFFVATATAGSRINLSPKGLDSLRVVDPNRVVWLNLTGSGNETAAHVRDTPRMTLMFCSFGAEPLILRLYGTATVAHCHDRDWARGIRLFNGLSRDLLCGARQIFDMRIDLVQTSCGFGVPLSDGMRPRPKLEDWTRAKGVDGIAQYWRDKNARTIDDAQTGIPGSDDQPACPPVEP
ncbi:MAG: pyridoxamine 5'-phosphate oxidase family protein [Gammaproteobacteria bacterium]|nr:pyridoxamine 5'-phosphate oxidase family protein [Gammaproteobacteria bacterium]